MADRTDNPPAAPEASRMTLLLHWGGVYIALPLLIGVVFADVVLRFVFAKPLMWGNEVRSLALLVVFFASLPYCTNTNGHVRMELIYNRLGRGGRRIADGVANGSGLVFAVFLTYQSFASAWEAWDFGDGAEFIAIPYWPFLVVMGACGLFMALIFAGRTARAVNGDAAGGG